MSKPTGAFQHGPVLSPQDFVPGGDSHEASGKCMYNGLDGLPKGSGGEVDQVILIEGGAFGKFDSSKITK